MAKHKKKSKRGFPVAVLIGLTQRFADFWIIYSASIMHIKKIEALKKRENMDKTQLYTFHENIVNELRPQVKEGIKSVIIATPQKSTYYDEFIDHLDKHQKWLRDEKNQNVANFGHIDGEFSKDADVKGLVNTDSFMMVLNQISSNGADRVISELEARLNSSEANMPFLYSFDDIQALFLEYNKGGKEKPELLVMTDEYFEANKTKGPFQWLYQIAKNLEVQTQIIRSLSPSGERLEQFGGIVCFIYKNELEIK